MNFLSKALLLSFLYVPLSYSNDNSKWDEQALTTWVGKYPTSTINGKRKSILSEENVKKILQKTVPSAELKKLNKYDVVTPIEKIDHYLVINKCMAHDCPAELAMVVIDLKAPVLWAGFFDREEHRVSTRWYTNGENDYAILPEEIKTMFLKRHGYGI